MFKHNIIYITYNNTKYLYYSYLDSEILYGELRVIREVLTIYTKSNDFYYCYINWKKFFKIKFVKILFKIYNVTR
jgi:hypothetical protein